MNGIIILGANGSGKSTLGRKLAGVLNWAHFDAEDYCFIKTDIPYTVTRPDRERNEMLLSDIRKHKTFVMSGDVSGWGAEFTSMFGLAVFLTAPVDIRLRRIEEREYARWGDRVRRGGDMYEGRQRFRAFAAARDTAQLERRASAYRCPLLHVDGTKPLEEITDIILRKLQDDSM